MATIGYVEIAERYASVTTGPRLTYSFETQEGQPVDGSNPMLRDLSPFTMFLLPPGGGTGADLVAPYVEAVGEEAFAYVEPFTLNVEAYTGASSVNTASQQAANNIRATFGMSMVDPNNSQSYDNTISNLESTVSVAQVTRYQGGSGEVIPTMCDGFTAADIALQVAQILNVPPLTLLINPSEMAITYQSIQNYTDRGRNGFIFQRWGEGQPTISFSGSTGAYMAGEGTSGAGFGGLEGLTRHNVGGALLNATSGLNEAQASDGYTNVATGVQFATMRDSAAFQNFISLYHFYRNNGLIYDTIGKSEAHLFVGSVAISYDQWIYVGHIESFEFSFTEESQHRMEWSMEFVCDEMYDTATSPSVVLPMYTPEPNPAYPGRASDRGGGSLSSHDAVVSSNGTAWLGVTGGPDSFQDNSSFDTSAYGNDLVAAWEDHGDDPDVPGSQWPTTQWENSAYTNQEDRDREEEMQQWIENLTKDD